MELFSNEFTNTAKIYFSGNPNNMTLEEIKTEIALDNPIAHLSYIDYEKICYYTNIENKIVYFEVPLNQIDKQTKFRLTIQSKNLIQWIKK